MTKFSDDRGNRMKPFESYLIGDWIGWNIAPEGSDELGFDGVLRVCGITVSEDEDTGDLSYTLELHDTMLEHEIRLNQKVERMSQYSGTDVLSVAPSSSGGYSDSEVNNMLASKANVNHQHTGVYSEIDHMHDFLALMDTPDSYLGQGTKVVAVKPDASGLEFVTVVGGGGGIGAVTELPSNPTNGQTVFMYNANYQYLATYYGPTAQWYKISLVGSNYPWTNVYKPEALYNLLFGDATKSIETVAVSTDFNTALRIKGATGTTKQLAWTFTSEAGDFGIWVGCETESTNYDWGYVYIDDVDISGKLGGTVVSRYLSKTLTAGSHTLKITYNEILRRVLSVI